MSDVKVGDLVKATRKGEPESTITGRVQTVTPRGGVLLRRHGSMWPEDYDFEVLDRPKPEIPEELLVGATHAYGKARGLGPLSDFELHAYGEGVSAVIDFINEYYNKENA